MSSEINIGDLVWAKFGRYAPWPARIVTPGPNTERPPAKSNKKFQWVCFFGTNDYAWIEDKSIYPYKENKERFTAKKISSAKFRKACKEIEDFARHLETGEPHMPSTNTDDDSDRDDLENEDDQFDKLLSPPKKTSEIPMKRKSSDIRSSLNKKRKSSLSPPLRAEENGVSLSGNDLGDKLINSPPAFELPESPTVEFQNYSELLKTKDITPSNLSFGFIGLGSIGAGIVMNLITSGHKVNIFSRTPKKYDPIKKYADESHPEMVNFYIAPCDVVKNSDIIFSCVTDPRAVTENIFGNCGVIGRSTVDKVSLVNKGYVEMTGIDPKTSKEICEMITGSGGRYLEAQIQGSKQESEEGSLVILAAGDRSLFVDCQSCFKAMGKTAFFLGDVEYATKVYLILQMMRGISLVGLAEGLALADRCGISSKDVLNIFNMTSLASPYLTHKAEMIVNKQFGKVEQAIQHMQKDMKLVLNLSDDLKQPLMMASTANEIYKHARRLGYDGHDVSCVYMRTRH